MSPAPSIANAGERRAVCVYCASSKSCDPVYHEAARDLGWQLATRGWTVVYGGGRVGSMGALAAGALGGGDEAIRHAHGPPGVPGGRPSLVPASSSFVWALLRLSERPSMAVPAASVCSVC